MMHHPPHYGPPPQPPPQQSNAAARAIMAGVGFMMTLFSMPCVLAMIHDLVTQADNITGALMIGGFFSVFALGGVLLMWSSWKMGKVAESAPPPQQDMRVIERQILAIAQRQGGQITAADIGLHTNLTVDEGQQLLEDMAKKGAAQMEIGPSGELVFFFANFGGAPANMSRDRDVSFGFDDAFDELEKQYGHRHNQDHKHHK